MKNITAEPIVVPWDYSDKAKDALAKAFEMAESPTTQIEVIHVTPYPSSIEPSIIWGEFNEDTIAENLHKSFRKEVDTNFQELRFTARFGDPGSQIAKFAKEKHAGLIVVSSHGRTGISRLLLGSVAERIVRLAPCPVLVLREE